MDSYFQAFLVEKLLGLFSLFDDQNKLQVHQKKPSISKDHIFTFYS